MTPARHGVIPAAKADIYWETPHARSPGPWLFPGAKPGTHVGPERIRQRLHELGI